MTAAIDRSASPFPRRGFVTRLRESGVDQTTFLSRRMLWGG